MALVLGTKLGHELAGNWLASFVHYPIFVRAECQDRHNCRPVELRKDRLVASDRWAGYVAISDGSDGRVQRHRLAVMNRNPDCYR